jgi:hypothetical protein
MPKAWALKNTAPSSAGMVLDMLENILADPEMDIQEKLGQLYALSVWHTFFDSPEQVVRIISVLANIIASDPSPKVRTAALGVMEQIIALEEKAEAEQGKPTIDWRTVDVLLREAKKQTKLDIKEAAVFAARPNAMQAIKPKPFVTASPDASIASAPAPVAERPQPCGVKIPAMEKNPEPPIMQFLRSVADTDNEEHIRALAKRIIARIGNLTAIKPPSSLAPALAEG